jgi:3-ketosteroid 9alpha-monooxygenase subunit A
MGKTQDYGLGEFTFPRGWFMVADAEEVKDRPVSVRFFAQDLVIYRGKSGRVVMLDAYCPHMGTHIGRNDSSYVIQDGQIEGDSIRCPYHAWRFGPDGKCNHIPYYDGAIPKAAVIRSWTVLERMGCIWAWHDPENGEPDYEVPDFAEWNDPQWVRWKIDQMGTIELHPQEVLDNMADVAHLNPVHGSTVEYFENEFRDHVVIQRQGGGPSHARDHQRHARDRHLVYGSGNSLLETHRAVRHPHADHAHAGRRRCAQGLACAAGKVAEPDRDR